MFSNLFNLEICTSLEAALYVVNQLSRFINYLVLCRIGQEVEQVDGNGLYEEIGEMFKIRKKIEIMLLGKNEY